MLALTVLASCVSLLWWIATLNTFQIWSMQPGDVHEDEARSILRTMILLFLALVLVGVPQLGLRHGLGRGLPQRPAHEQAP